MQLAKKSTFGGRQAGSSGQIQVCRWKPGTQEGRERTCGGPHCRVEAAGFLCRDGAPLQVSLLRKEVIVQAMFAEAVRGSYPDLDCLELKDH